MGALGHEGRGFMNGISVNIKRYWQLLFFFSCFFRVAPVSCGVSQARGRIGATAASLHQSHSNTRPKLHLRPTPQLTAMQDP